MTTQLAREFDAQKKTPVIQHLKIFSWPLLLFSQGIHFNYVQASGIHA